MDNRQGERQKPGKPEWVVVREVLDAESGLVTRITKSPFSTYFDPRFSIVLGTMKEGRFMPFIVPKMTKGSNSGTPQVTMDMKLAHAAAPALVDAFEWVRTETIRAEVDRLEWEKRQEARERPKGQDRSRARERQGGALSAQSREAPGGEPGASLGEEVTK